MATYAGYQRINTPDLSAPFGEKAAGLMNQYAAGKAQEAKQAQEQMKLRKAEMDKLDEGYYDAMAKISSTGVTDYPDKTFQDVVFNATTGGRDQLKMYHEALKNGQISNRDYKMIETNMLSSFNALKEYQENSAEFANAQVERMKKKESGYLEEERAQYNAQLSNLRNKTAAFDADGNLMWQTLDADGNVVNQQSVINLVSANNISNQFVDRTNLKEVVENIASSDGGYTYAKGSKTITDPTAQEGYTGWVNGQVRTVTQGGNPQRITSLLMDGNISENFTIGGKEVSIDPGTFRTEGELKNKVDQELMEIIEDYELELSEEDAKALRKEISTMMIPITTEGGKDMYGINTKHKTLVEDRIKEDIRIKLGYKETKRSASTGSGKPSQTQRISDKVRELSDKAWNEKSDEAFGNLDKGYMYVPSNGMINIYKRQYRSGVDITQKLINSGNMDPTTVAYGPEDLSDYAESIATAQVRYEFGQTVPGGGQTVQAGAGDDVFESNE